MDYGAVFPTTDIGNDPVAIRDWSQAAEALGYRRITTYDHVLGAERSVRVPPLVGPPYDEHDAFHEPMVLFGYLSACTRSIELATGILVLPQRQTALVAKQAAEVAVLSSGRFILGVGNGWNHVEFEALGVSFSARGARCSEQVDVLRELLTGNTVDFTGEFHRIDRARLLPAPGKVPIWFGGKTDAAFERAAAKGDGFTFSAGFPEVGDLARRFQEIVATHGRSALPMDATIAYAGGPDRWLEAVAVWRRSGGHILSMSSMETRAARSPGVSASSVGTHIAALEHFMSVVL